MGEPQSRLSFLLLGEQSLLLQCAELLKSRGHSVVGIVSRNRQIAGWAAQSGIPCLERFEVLQANTEAHVCDYLISITNLRMLPAWLLGKARRGAINFHDGPLPAYAGLNAPVWALMHGETTHGVTWHEIVAEADKGRVLVQNIFPIAEGETAFGLNAQCYQEGLASFQDLVSQLEDGSLAPRNQDFTRRTYFGAADRPASAATLDWSKSASDLARLVRALDFGRYPNPVLLPKVDLGSGLLLAREAKVVSGNPETEKGAIQAITTTTLTVRCGDGALEISALTDVNGAAVDVRNSLEALGLRIGNMLPGLGRVEELSDAVKRAAKYESWWLEQLASIELSELPFAQRESSGQPKLVRLDARLLPGDEKSLIASFLLLLARLNGRRDAAITIVPVAKTPDGVENQRYFAPLAVLRSAYESESTWASYLHDVSIHLDKADEAGPWLSDLAAREPDMRAPLGSIENSRIRLVRCKSLPGDAAHLPIVGAALVVAIDRKGNCAAWIDGTVMSQSARDRLAASWSALIRSVQEPGARCNSASVVSEDDRRLLDIWQTSSSKLRPSPGMSELIHEQFEAQAALAPTRRACVFEGRSVSYEDLNASANQLARYLQSIGVQPGNLVGILVPRSIEMVVSILAVLKAGATYVPLDPTYPADRLAFMASDAGLRVIVSRGDARQGVAAGQVVRLDEISAQLSVLPHTNLNVPGKGSDLAYVIYTSGSTGKPKGVMVEHRNVANFFRGIDRRFGTQPGVWLAVTSISFDISVLELLWTLARGFTVVIHGDALRIKGSKTPAPLASARGERQPLDFGLFYWNVAKTESDYDDEKYRLLLESARFADTHGFNAVWTPERHFEAFGGLFPNPSVTSAALATITKNVKLRAGSCVVPLHSPIRVAEEWAVVDNLSNGRVGMSVASGWAPPDFVIRPESFANAKQVMFESTEIIKRLWRGETVSFPGPKGEVKVRTLPRPVQKELPIWVTTAGNIDTYIQAAKAGANVLTHLLGQSIEDVADKVIAYRKAWTEAGHSGRGIVTVMLHTLVGPDPDIVEKIVRQPMKDYLKSAVFLVKAAAWQFPTFKKLSDEQGKSLDDFFSSISDQDMEDLLEFAFLRYFKTSGLFGTPEQCLEMVRHVENADVDEIACLIDFGIRTDVVLEHLPYLDQLRALAQSRSSGGDHSLANLLQTEGVSHFQCTPTMATMLASDPDAQSGLARLKHMMVGGEALPPDLARALSGMVKGRVSNMYGPTETTIWSTVGDVDAGAITPSNGVSIGTPLEYQSVYVLDESQQPMPIGISGEIVIGGMGVTRGYWQRKDTTAEKFLPDPFATHSPGARMYRTGDLGRILPDGRLECLGRLDQQVKIRGFRVELGEIEALLRDQEGVAEAAVVLRELAPGDQRLIGYVRSSGGEMDPASLRTGLSRQLPDFMIPSAIVVLEAMPMTPNGKIDRKALPLPNLKIAPIDDSAAEGEGRVSTDTESLVMEIWKKALGVTRIGARENFFDIGGHSLLVIQVLKELRERVSKPIQMTDLFRHTTVESLARFLGEGESVNSAAVRGVSRASARRKARS